MENLENEIWKDVKGYEGLYQVSNLGKVKSLKRLCNSKFNSKRIIKERILKSHKNTSGYLSVVLCKNKSKSFTIHRLVLINFSCLNKNKQVNHINGNKLDNRLENLEWCNSSENLKHAYLIGLKKPMFKSLNPMSKLNENKITEIRKLSKQKISNKEIAKIYKVSTSLISKIINNQYWFDENYKFKKNKKGLLISGFKNCNSKINKEIFQEIIKCRNIHKMKYKEMSIKFNLSISTLNKIINQKTYKNEQTT